MLPKRPTTKAMTLIHWLRGRARAKGEFGSRPLLPASVSLADKKGIDRGSALRHETDRADRPCLLHTSPGGAREAARARREKEMRGILGAPGAAKEHGTLDTVWTMRAAMEEHSHRHTLNMSCLHWEAHGLKRQIHLAHWRMMQRTMPNLKPCVQTQCCNPMHKSHPRAFIQQWAVAM